MPDYFRLGLPDDLREYTLADIRQYNASLANPFTAKVDTSSEFGALDAYSEWVVEDWQAGAGKRNPAEGGMLFSHMDTRFPNQMILPIGWELPYFYMHPSGGVRYVPGDHSLAVGEKLSVSYTATGADTIGGLWVYVDAPNGTVVTVALCSNLAPTNRPNAVLSTSTATVSRMRPGPMWVPEPGINRLLTAGAIYHIVISANQPITVPKVQTPGTGWKWDLAQWNQTDAGFAWFSSFVRNTTLLKQQSGFDLLLQWGNPPKTTVADANPILLNHANMRARHIVTTLNRVYAGYSNIVVELKADTMVQVTTTGAANITDMQASNGEVFVAYGSGYKVINVTTGAVVDITLTPTELMYVGLGFLWRASGNTLWYTDGVGGWIEVQDRVGPPGYGITGLAEMAEHLYMTTGMGLYMLADGDFVVPVTKWPTTDTRNGVGVVEWMGALYVPLAEDIVRYSQDGAVVQVGLRTGEELPSDIQGIVYRLTATNYFLLASVEPTQHGGTGSLWAYNGTGWHGIGQLAPGVSGGAILVDTLNNWLYWGGGYGLIHRSIYPSSVVNPVRDNRPKLFSRTGWIEQDRFYGNFRRLIKDFESVYLDTERLPPGTITPYWKDDRGPEWRMLGVADEENEELRWEDLATRPMSKWLRLALLMRTDDPAHTPILRAHVLKFHSMANDRWRWPLVIPLSAGQQMMDGRINPYPLAERINHIESLIFQPGPFLYQDIDHTGTRNATYWVKAIAAQKMVNKAVVLGDGTDKVFDYVYAVTIEQLTKDLYVAPA